jgi:uncharacterized RDD family membrane protein YckC
MKRFLRAPIASLTLIFAVLTVPAASLAGPADLSTPNPVSAGPILSGSGRTSWLVTPQADTFRVHALSQGKRWAPMVHETRGAIRWSQGSDDQLYLLSGPAPGALLIYSDGSSSPRIASLSKEAPALDTATVLAGFAGRDVFRGGAAAGELGPCLLLFGLPAGEDATPTFWMHTLAGWSTFAAPEKLTDVTAGTEGVFCTAADGQVYLLSAQTQQFFREQTPDEWDTLTHPTFADGEQPIAMLTIDNTVVLVSAVPFVPAPAPAEATEATVKDAAAEAAPQWTLAIRTLADGAFGDAVSVSLNNEPFAIPSVPQVVSNTGRLLLVWNADATQPMQYTFFTLAGVAEPARSVPQSEIATPDPENERIIQYVLFGILGLGAVAMFTGRPNRPIGPMYLPPEYKPAGMLRRVGALAIDLMILSTGMMILMALLGLTLPEPQTLRDLQMIAMDQLNYLLASKRGLACLLSLFVGIVVYGTVLEKLVGGTLGKLVLRIKVVRSGGEPLTWRDAYVRNSVKLLELSILWVPLLVILFNPARQRLGDVLARTMVVEPSGLSVEQIETIRTRMEQMGITSNGPEATIPPPAPPSAQTIDPDEDRP